MGYQVNRGIEAEFYVFVEDSPSRAEFGDVMFDAWIEFKRGRWLGDLNHVADWARDCYLKFSSGAISGRVTGLETVSSDRFAGR